MYFKIAPPQKPKEKPKVFLKWVKDRIDKNMNCIIVFNGSTGSAKSLASLKLAFDVSQMFGTPFTITGNLSFKFKDLLGKMQLPQNQEPGSCFIMEEVGSFGSGASSREWQSQANKFFFSFLQTSRHKNQILILNCPSFSYLEKGSRELVHFQFDAMYIDHKKKLSFFKPFAIQCNRRTGKLYFKFLRYKHDGMRKYMNKMSFELPPEDITKLYEIDKLKFTTELNKTILEGNDDKKGNKLGAIQENATKRREIVGVLHDTGKTNAKISELIGISTRQVQRDIRRNQKGL